MPAEIAAFFDSYRDAFDRLDADGIAGHFALPSMLIDGETRVWARRDEIVANMDGLLGLYRNSGYASAAYTVEELLWQGKENAVVNIRWIIARHGAAAWRFCTGYNLRRFVDGWKIVACTAYEESWARRS